MATLNTSRPAATASPSVRCIGPGSSCTVTRVSIFCGSFPPPLPRQMFPGTSSSLALSYFSSDDRLLDHLGELHALFLVIAGSSRVEGHDIPKFDVRSEERR